MNKKLLFLGRLAIWPFIVLFDKEAIEAHDHVLLASFFIALSMTFPVGVFVFWRNYFSSVDKIFPIVSVVIGYFLIGWLFNALERKFFGWGRLD